MDASQYDMFLLCAARYNMRYNQNRVVPHKEMRLDRGTIVHVGMEVYYEALKNHALYTDAVTAALSKVREAGVTASDLEPEMINRTLDVMEEYFDYWRAADENIQILEVEKPFLYLLYEDDEIRMFMSGKIDLLINDDRYSKLPYDHKTYERSFELTRMTNQFRNYANAVNSNYLMVNRVGFQTSLKPHEKFKRVMLSYDPLCIQQWKDNVVIQMTHYLQCVAEGKWPMNETSCDKYYRRCEYYEVCDSSGEPAKLYKLNANYQVIEPWDVSKVLRKATEELKDEQAKGEKANVIVD